MPEKIKQYQSADVIYNPSGKPMCKLPEKMINANIDPSLWAFSTMASFDDIDLVNIYVIKQKKYMTGGTTRHRMWLHDILDNEGIPYQVVIKGYWSGLRVYAEDQFINVEKKHRRKAKRLIKEFTDSNNAVAEIPEDDNADGNYVDGIPQIKCSSCNREIDFDYHKCPFCGTSL